jgi:hypothetical protein
MNQSLCGEDGGPPRTKARGSLLELGAEHSSLVSQGAGFHLGVDLALLWVWNEVR